jgi:YggT family protein
MLFQMVSLLLNVVGGLLTSLCLLRLYMQFHRIGFFNPLGRLIFALTDWVVMPLRRLIRPVGRWDMSSLIAAAVIQLIQQGLLWVFFLYSALSWLGWLWMAFFGLIFVLLGGCMFLLVVYAVLSWVQTGSPFLGILSQLCSPLLRPVRRLIPTINGIDLSVLVVLIILQLLLIATSHLQMNTSWIP